MLKIGTCPIVCAGPPWGLANRLLNLTSVIRVCESVSRPIYLWWPLNWHIGNCQFNKLFQNEFTTYDNPSIVIKPVHEGHNRWVLKEIPSYLFGLRFPRGFGLPEDPYPLNLSKYFKTLIPATDIYNIISDFTEKNNLSRMIGIHIRSGDKYPPKWVDVRYDNLMSMIVEKIPSVKFFVACDGKHDFLEKFDCVYYEKLKSPLIRNRDATKEAYIDLLLLSKVPVIIYGVGTFGWAASLFGNSKGFNIMTGSANCISHCNRYKVDLNYMSDNIVENYLKVC